jgi:hypothetical protein
MTFISSHPINPPNWVLELSGRGNYRKHVAGLACGDLNGEFLVMPDDELAGGGLADDVDGSDVERGRGGGQPSRELGEAPPLGVATSTEDGGQGRQGRIREVGGSTG